MTTYILGIDPGNKGAVALLSLDGSELDWFKVPTRVEVEGTQKKRIDGKDLYEHLANFDILTCYIEKQAYKNPKLIANYGICMGVLDALDIPFMSMPPASWMKSLKSQIGFDDIKNGPDKEFTFKAFEYVYPNVELPKKGKGLDDDIADAALLAYLCYLNIERYKD